MKRYYDFKSFSKLFKFQNEFIQSIDCLLEKSLMPFKVTKYYADLIKETDLSNRNQLMNIILPPQNDSFYQGRIDPYGNSKYRDSIYHFIQHKYEKTLLIHLIDSCWSNCQFCYKVNEIRHEGKSNFSFKQRINLALEYLKNKPEIDNILLSGGDPFIIKIEKLIEIIEKLIKIDQIRVIRIATKALVFNPNIFFDKSFLNIIEKINNFQGKQITIIAHINHPAEITDDCQKVIKVLSNIGVQFRGQPTIVKGVNDNVEILVDLQRKFIDSGIISYYLTLFMPVKGVEQYALTLDIAYKLVSKSKQQLNGLEKKGVLLASHDFGKFEICGFYPTIENPQKIILKWHQATMKEKLPKEVNECKTLTQGDILFLDYKKNIMYCIDDVFQYNKLPYYDINGDLKL